MNLFELYQNKRVYFIKKIRRYVHDHETAEDIVQAAFVKGFEKYDQYNPKKSSLKTWMTKVLFSTLWNHVREVKKLPPLYDIEGVLNSELLAYEEEPSLREYIRSIPNTKHRQILLGVFVLGNTYQEVADLANVTEDNVRKIVQRFREKCR